MYQTMNSNYIKFFDEMRTDRKYKLMKKFTYLTHIKGPHLDFYNNPLGFNGNNFEKKVRKLRSKFIKAMLCIIYCEKCSIYVNRYVVETIIEQLRQCSENDEYWMRYGFNSNQIKRINFIYSMLSNFYQDYLLKIKKGTRKNKMKSLYEFMLKFNTGLNINPMELRDFALRDLERNIRRMQNIKMVNNEEKITSEQELLTVTKKIVIDNYEKIKNIFNKDVKIPNVTRITVKSIPSVLSLWSSKGYSYKNTIYVNTKNYNSYTKKDLQKIVAREGLPGRLLEKYNKDKVISKLNIPEELKSTSLRGIKMLKDGWSLYAEKIMLNENDETLLLDRIYYNVITIIDIELNYESVNSEKLTEARKLLKEYTNLSESSIDTEVYRCLGHPTEACTYLLGLVFYEKLMSNISSNVDRKNMYSKILLEPLSIKDLTKSIT